MTNRALYEAIMHYGSFDRMPLVHWKAWTETYQRWHREGYPSTPEYNQWDCPKEHEFFGTQPHWDTIWYEAGLFPAFPETTLEETEDFRIFRDGAGVVQKSWKAQSGIPHHVDYTLKTAADWPAFKERLQPDPGRISGQIEATLISLRDRNLPVVFWTGSMMGWIRDWMGVENMCYLMYDSPEVYGDMVDTLSRLVCWAADQILPLARKVNCPVIQGFGWEDICGKSGPLVSPDLFDAHVAPGYRRIRCKLEEYGINIYGVDSDGLVEPLIQHWLDAGVNLMFPIEPGTWGATPEAMRQKFGKELLIVGGFDKLVLEKSREAIDAEIEAHMELMKEGGFMMMPDHFITPGTPLANYQYYLDRMRRLRLR